MQITSVYSSVCSYRLITASVLLKFKIITGIWRPSHFLKYLKCFYCDFHGFQSVKVNRWFNTQLHG